MARDDNPAEPAGDVDVQASSDEGAEDRTEVEAGADDNGQEEDQPAGKEAAKADPDPDDKTRSQERRERRKAHMDQLKREADEAREKIARLRKAAEGETEPKETDFEDLTEYAIAKAAWKLSSKAAAREESEAAERAKAAEDRQTAARREAWLETVAASRDKYQDFEAVVNNPNVQIARHVADLIVESDLGPDLAYSIASNPAEAARISALEPLAAAREIGRLEATLSRAAPPRQSKAPPPIKPVNAGGSAARDPSEMTATEYRAWREQGGTL